MEVIINRNDFYEWAYSDLLVNNQRGHLAEFIVATALGVDSQKRSEWDPYDLKYNDINFDFYGYDNFKSFKESLQNSFLGETINIYKVILKEKY